VESMTTLHGFFSALTFDENRSDENTAEDANNNSSSFVKNNMRPQGPHESFGETHYNRRKPRWWRQRSGKATKSQRTAMQSMKQQNLFLERPAYGECFDWNSVFAKTSNNNHNNQTVWLEIGFGGGDNLLCLAQDYPDIDFVGAEVHSAGLGKVCQHIQRVRETSEPYAGFTRYVDVDKLRHSLDQAEKSPHITPVTVRAPFSNVRLYGGDGVGLLDYIPSDSLSAILLTFPDPFAKASEQEWRIIQGHTLQLIVDKLRKPFDHQQPGASTATQSSSSTTGGRFYLATDHPVFHDWTHTMIEQSNRSAADAVRQRDRNGTTTTARTHVLLQLVEPCPDRQGWLPVISAYEKKGWESGRRTLLSCWQVVALEHKVKEKSTSVETLADS